MKVTDVMIAMIVVSQKRVIRSNGFSVQLESDKVIFSMDGKYLQLDIESSSPSEDAASGPAEITINRDSIRKWLPPHSRHVINDGVKEQIIKGMVEALRLLRVNCIIG